jgi:autotransporter family porin
MFALLVASLMVTAVAGACPPTGDAAESADFGTIAPGSPLPSDAACAAGVRPAPEIRPGNSVGNSTPGSSKTMPAEDWVGATTWRDKYYPRVDGAFTGTTDEILQWVSCKWGIDEDVTRARAAVESTWRQDFLGDAGHSTGILQVKCMFDGDPHRYTYPECSNSTSYNADYATAFVRACYDNLFAENGWFHNTVPATPTDPSIDQRLWECVGLWFSGQFMANDSAYIAAVKQQYASKPWLRSGY